MLQSHFFDKRLHQVLMQLYLIVNVSLIMAYSQIKDI